MKYVPYLLAIAVVFFGSAIAAKADVNEGFDNFDIGVRPSGWTFNYCGHNSDAETAAGYFGAASPSITLDAYGDQIITQDITGNPSAATSVQWWLRSFASNPSSSLLVREYVSGAWSRLTFITGLPTTATTYGPISLNPSGATRVEFTYKEVNDVDIYIDDVVIVGAATPVPTATPVLAPTPLNLVVDWDDYDGDGTSDIAVYNAGTWAVRNITSGLSWGSAGDIPVPGDYDGDGIADYAYFDRSDGNWYVLGIGTTQWPVDYNGDIPVPGDYDGDGTADLATWRPSDGIWRVQGVTSVWYGATAGMIPVPGDYDGDGTTDMAQYLPSTGYWYARNIGAAVWGYNLLPVPGDYDGDSATEIAVVKEISGIRYWYIRDFSGGGQSIIPWGKSSDLKAILDYDGDGDADLVGYRPSNDLWWIRDLSGLVGYTTYDANPSDTIVDGAASY